MDFIEIGVVLKPQGIKGEVKVRPYTDDISDLAGLKSLYIQKDGRYTEHSVLNVRLDREFAFLTIQGITDRNAAEAARNTVLYIKKEDEGLPEGAFYIRDLIGLAVEDEQGESLGVLKDVLTTGAADVYVVKDREKGFMFPALKRVILKTDIQNKKMTLDSKALSEVAVYEV